MKITKLGRRENNEGDPAFKVELIALYRGHVDGHLQYLTFTDEDVGFYNLEVCYSRGVDFWTSLTDQGVLEVRAFATALLARPDLLVERTVPFLKELALWDDQ